MSESSDRPAWEKPGRFERAGIIPTPAERPPGWPQDVPVPGSPEWVRRAMDWMFELCPPGYRRHRVLQEYPLLLARLARHHVVAMLMAHRHGYGTVRVDLRGSEPPVVDAALRVHEHEGVELAAREREIALVETALLKELRRQ